jgi:hypothetical protein
MAVCAMLPNEPRRTHEVRQPPLDPRILIPAVLGITVGVASGATAATLIVAVFKNYGTTLFFGTPFLMGTLTAFFLNRRYRASSSETMLVALLMFGVSAGVMFLMATEGVICILMAVPIAVPTGLIGASIGRSIAQIGQNQAPPAFLALLILPLAAVTEPAHAGRLLHEVRSSVEIELEMSPEGYWQVFTDYLIGRIHNRVLAHIKDEVERVRL